ncbi:MAG: hypothetical protein RLZZ253_2810, partial [Verrucomicrobiota bacterium]
TPPRDNPSAEREKARTVSIQTGRAAVSPPPRPLENSPSPPGAPTNSRVNPPFSGKPVQSPSDFRIACAPGRYSTCAPAKRGFACHLIPWSRENPIQSHNWSRICPLENTTSEAPAQSAQDRTPGSPTASKSRRTRVRTVFWNATAPTRSSGRDAPPRPTGTGDPSPPPRIPP